MGRGLHTWVLVFAISVAGAAYVPGTPGGEWSTEEVRIVREKVLHMLDQDEDKKAEMFKDFEKRNEYKTNTGTGHPVSEMVLFRLSFHDCIAYKDGSPGCDGCLNWKNMDNPAPSPFAAVKDRYCEHQFPIMNATDNNGMMRITHYLEKIYNTTDWPSTAPVLETTLWESGKSRADLWQFAANVALELTIERSNYACRYDMWQRQQIPLLEGINAGRDLDYGIWKCKIKLTAPVKFRFGRKDCIPDDTLAAPYITTKAEAHENPHENVGQLLDDLKNNLNMKARDFIALSSIHGMIRPFQKGSIGTKYRWVGNGPYLSNMYYKILVNKPTYTWTNGFGINPTNLPSYNFDPFAYGDAEGKPVATWGMRVGCSNCWNSSQTTMGGPCVWRPTQASSVDLPNKGVTRQHCYGGWDTETKTRFNRKWGNCCNDATWTPEGIQIGGKCSHFTDKSQTQGWSNMFALNYEVGFTHKFDIDNETFRATGCPGLELEDRTGTWEGGTHSNSQYMSPAAQCDKQDLVEETGTPVYDIVQEFADDHSVWAEAFLGAWERMQELRQEGMKDGPYNSWLGYYMLQDMGADIGEDYAGYIEANKPLVFTTENIDPFLCGNNAGFCNWKFSQVYEAKELPIEDFGPSCTDVTDCNPKFEF